MELGSPSQLFSAAPEQRLFFWYKKTPQRFSVPPPSLSQVWGINQSLITDVANTFWPHFCSCWVQKPTWQLQGSVFSLNPTATAILQLRKEKALKCGALLQSPNYSKFQRTLGIWALLHFNFIPKCGSCEHGAVPWLIISLLCLNSFSCSSWRR